MKFAVLAFILVSAGGAALAQNNPCQTTQPVSTLGSAPTAQAAIVYDPNQGVCWLANANLPGDPAMSLGVAGIDPNGSMDYATALRWIAALNAYNNGSGYLGHNNWQLPVAPLVDRTCADVGTHGGSFGPQCTGSAFGSLYSMGVKQIFPASVAPGFAGAVPPMQNMKSSYYWALENNGGTSGTDNGGQEMFSFANGIQGGTTINDTYYYILPVVAGAIGAAPSCPAGATAVVPYTSGPASGSAVYDCNTGYTWPADANLAASNNFGITGNLTVTYPSSRTITVPKISGGAMLFQTAMEWVQAMNHSTYLGSSAWEIPATSKTLQGLFVDLNMVSGDSRLMWTGAIGPFQNLQPFFYWACQREQAGNSQSSCTDYAPADGSSQLQWSFDFDDGFQSTSSLIQKYFVMVYYPAAAATGPVVSIIANAEGESLTIAPNTWVEIKGSNLAPSGDSRIWRDSDFAGNKMPTQLDGVSVAVNGNSSYVYYISPEQISILTSPEAISGPTQVVVMNNGATSATVTALAQTLSPSFFVFNGGPYAAAVHSSGGLIGPTSLYPGSTTPAKPGETILLYANGFGPTSQPVASGSVTQGGTLTPTPAVKIGNRDATVTFAGLVGPGEFQFNVIIPSNTPDGDQPITSTYNGSSTQPGTLITIQH